TWRTAEDWMLQAGGPQKKVTTLATRETYEGALDRRKALRLFFSRPRGNRLIQSEGREYGAGRTAGAFFPRSGNDGFANSEAAAAARLRIGTAHQEDVE